MLSGSRHVASLARPDSLGIECEAEHSVWLCFDFVLQGDPRGLAGKTGRAWRVLLLTVCDIWIFWDLGWQVSADVLGFSGRFVKTRVVCVSSCFVSLAHVWKVHDTCSYM